MERRAPRAALLGAALLVAYKFFSPPPRQEARARRPAAEGGTPATPPLAPPTPATSAAPRPPAPRPLQRLATVETPRYNAVVSSEGGKLQEFVLKYRDRKSTRLNSSHGYISYAGFCLKKKDARRSR